MQHGRNDDCITKDRRRSRSRVADVQPAGEEKRHEAQVHGGVASGGVPDDQLTAAVEQLARELGSRNAVTLESAKIAAYMQKDMDFMTALKTDDLVSHRMRYYTNPLSDAEGDLHSQKGGGTTGYAKPEDRKK